MSVFSIRVKLVCLLAMCFGVGGCYSHRDLTEYRLDEATFDAEAIEKIEQEAGIDLPDNARGLKFHHLPPIDPIVFAKIELPDDAQDSLASQIGAFTFPDNSSFPQDFANSACEWWPGTPTNAVLSKQAFNNDFYVELYLLNEPVDEKERLVLYIKYFTI